MVVCVHVSYKDLFYGFVINTWKITVIWVTYVYFKIFFINSLIKRTFFK